MKPKHIMLVAGLSLLSLGALNAEPVKMSRAAASELYAALNSVEAGLSPANVVVAADDLVALRPLAEALDKSRVAYQRGVRALARLNAPDTEVKAEALQDQFQATADAEQAVELTPIKLSDDEIKECKLRPGTLAVLVRYLKPKTK